MEVTRPLLLRRLPREVVELLVVFVLCPLTFLASALQYPLVEPAYYEYYRSWFYSPGTFASSLIQSLGMGLLVAYVVTYHWPETRERWEDGLRRQAGLQALASLGLLLVLTISWFVLEVALWKLAGKRLPSNEWMLATTWTQRLEILAWSLVNGPAEELLRAYLVSRVYALTRRGVVAVAVSAAIFASYHLYQGWTVVAFFLAGGFFLGWVYWRQNWLITLVLWHTLADLMAIVPPSSFQSLRRLFGLPD